MPLQVDVDAKRLVPGAVLRRLADEYRRSGHGREDRVGQGRRSARRAFIRLELGVTDLAHLDRSLATLDVEGDGHLLD